MGGGAEVSTPKSGRTAQEAERQRSGGNLAQGHLKKWKKREKESAGSGGIAPEETRKRKTFKKQK